MNPVIEEYTGARVAGSTSFEAISQPYRDLRKIDYWIIPKEERHSRYEISTYESAMRSIRIRGNSLDVELAIKILHRSDV